MRQQLEYGLAALLVAYIAFGTRPAPAAIVNLLANPAAQLVALGAVAYVGAMHSLLLALLMGLAFVLSTPTREYADDPSIKKKDAAKHAEDKKLEAKKPAAPAAAKKPAATHAKKPAATPAAAKKPEEKEEPTAAGQKVGKETFTSGIASTAASF